jgi:NAD(P)H dehydrogenase (quinone)
MYTITGITGKVGGALAQTLLASGQPVRGVVRDARKGEAWASRGCEPCHDSSRSSIQST